MAGRISRQGKKFAGRHSSYIPMAGDLVDHLVDHPSVEKISAGIITTRLPNLQGRVRIKIIDEGACFLLRVRANISQQEVRVYTHNKQAVCVLITSYATKQGISLSEKA